MNSVPEQPGRRARRAIPVTVTYDDTLTADERQSIMTRVLHVTWTKILGDDTARIVPDMTHDEAMALHRLGLAMIDGRSTESTQRDLEVVQAAIARINGVLPTEPPDSSVTPKPKRTPRLKPSSIAAFEAQWQAERAGDEAES
jgi:hypothetical protein